MKFDFSRLNPCECGGNDPYFCINRKEVLAGNAEIHAETRALDERYQAICGVCDYQTRWLGTIDAVINEWNGRNSNADE